MRIGTILAMAALLAASGPGTARADLVFPNLSYRTGPYAPTGIPFADGYADYFTLLNERDGGINGVAIQVLECETGYSVEKALECYEATRGQGSLLYQPLSTDIAYRLIAKATADGIPVHTMGYGRASAANGRVFPWVFNHPATDWDAASIVVGHMADLSGGSLEGKRIALVHLDSAFGREPVRAFAEFAARHGFRLALHPVDHPGQEQKATWSRIGAERPDFVVLWGWGVMNQVAIQEAVNIGFPMERLIGSWWSASETDVLPAGQGADGYRAVAFHGAGTGYPLYEDLKKYVFDAGKAAGDGTHAGEVLYNRGLYAAALAAEAARTAMRLADTTKLTPAMMRDGLENLTLDGARMARIGLPGFGPEIRNSCAAHGNPGYGAIQRWDATERRWSLITGFSAADREVVDSLVAADSRAYAAENRISPLECAE